MSPEDIPVTCVPLSSQRGMCDRPARRLSTGPQSTASRAQGHDCTLPHLNKYPLRGPYCISLVVWFFCLLHYTTQATISSVKHKELFHRNYLEKYVPGTFFSQTYCCLHSHRSLSTEKIRQIVMLCNVRSAHVSQYQVHKFQTCILGSSHELDSGVWIPPKSDNSANSSVLDNISQLALATAIFLTVFTDEI